MSVALVQSVVAGYPQGSTGPYTASPTLTGVQAGNTLVCVSALRYNSSPVTSISTSDAQGDYTVLVDESLSYGSSNYVCLDISVLYNASAGTHAVTATCGGNTTNAYGYCVMMELSGVGEVDVQATSSGSGSYTGIVSGTTAAVAGTNEIAIAAVALQSSSSTVIEGHSGFTNIFTQSDSVTGGLGMKCVIDYLTPLSAGTQQDTFTKTDGSQFTTNPYWAGIVVFRPIPFQPPSFKSSRFELPDTIYAESRIDHAARMFQVRRGTMQVIKAPPLWALQVPRPSPAFFESPFAGVISSLEFWSDQEAAAATIASARHLAYMVLPSPVLVEDHGDMPEARLPLKQIAEYFVAPETTGIAMQVFSQEFPDLTDPVWQEPVVNRFDYASAMFMLRQFGPMPQPPPPLAALLLPPPAPWLQDPAPDALRPFDYAGQFFMLRQFAAPPPVATPTTVRVKALSVGFYNGETRNIGDVFDIPTSDLALQATNFLVGIEGTPFFGWMVVVPSTTPLQINAPTPLNSTNVPRTVF